mgnify:CR=1 FL=1
MAVSEAVREDHRNFERLIVSSEDGAAPCGMCRQTLADFCGGETAVVVADGGDGTTDPEVDRDEGQGAALDGTDGEVDGIVAMPLEAGATGGDQRLRLMNGGEELATSEVRVDVSLPEKGTNATVTNMPADRLEEKNVEGDDLLDRSYGGVGGATTEETWQETELILRVKHSDDGAELSPGDSVRVEVTHVPTDEVVFSETVEAE